MAIALARAGYTVSEIVHRGDKFLPVLRVGLPAITRFVPHNEFSGTSSDVLVIAAGDPDISTIARSVSRGPELPRIALHTSGSLSSGELAALADEGVKTGSMHPLAALSDPVSGAERFRGAYFCIEGDAEAIAAAEKLAVDLEGVPFSIPTDSKALYHAAAVMAAGHVVALFDAAVEMLVRCGLGPEEARRVLLPLTSGSLANLGGRGSAAALTGPFARGDASALERHLAAFDNFAIGDELRDIYLQLALRSVELMIEAGRDYDELRERILIAKRQGG